MTLKNIETPAGLDPAQAERILNDAAGETTLSKRIEQISRRLLGRPYVEGSLGGGPDVPEELRISLESFDCVTFIETVLALSLARTIDEFIDVVRGIRYAGGEIDWFGRNHYMVDWVENNEAGEFVKNLTSGPYALEKTCTLGLIAGLPEKTTTFRYFPTQNRAQVCELFTTGDLILFVSTRETLDVFHAGLLVAREGSWLLRHATRTAGVVIEQELVEFMGQNQMAGIVLLRPLCRR